MKTNKIITLISLLILTIIVINPSVLSEETQNILYVDDDGDNQYSTIQEALNNATDGDTIYIYNGTYYECFSINKSISLIGENKDTTIISSLGYQNAIALLTILADNVKVSGFTITNSTMLEFLPSEIINGGKALEMMINVGIGIMISSNNNAISGNIIKNNGADGIIFNFGQNTIISNNEISNNYQRGIYLKNCSNNLIVNNTIKNSYWGVVFLNESYENVFYHNNFINNSLYHTSDNGKNIFYSTELKQGNYWDDYNGTDKNNDAICDMPYNITGGGNKDMYPLMSPYTGRLIVEEYYVDEVSVQLMLVVGIIIAIIFCLPIGLWWRKKYFK